jgi:hypothetical protein
MLVYYTFQDSNGRPFLDHSKKQTWAIDIPSSANIGKMKELLGLWHSLDPLSLTMSNLFRSIEYVDEISLGVFAGSCAKFPLVCTVNDGTISELPISRVLWYLVTREKKYKPIVYAI